MSVQCNGKEIDGEIFHLWNPAKFLYDIAEDEKEALNTSASSTEMSLIKNTYFNSQISKKVIQEDRMKRFNPGRSGLKILSNEKVITNLHRQSKTHVAPTKNKNEKDGTKSNDDDLKKAIAASISSIRSHEILIQVNDGFSCPVFWAL
uniref:Uncharacterized protein n=1 Tax=Acrobeloides nanus TaxID=290746 RepID=A0A914CX96_9BILA